MDIFYVQGHPNIQFRTVAPIDNRNKKTLLHETAAVINLQITCAFAVTDLHTKPFRLNDTAADDHVGKVERSICTMKERVRTTIHAIPFQQLLKILIRELVYNAAKGLNQFPATDGSSERLSPLAIMTGRLNPNHNDLKLEFGSYAQVSTRTVLTLECPRAQEPLH